MKYPTTFLLTLALGLCSSGIGFSQTATLENQQTAQQENVPQEGQGGKPENGPGEIPDGETSVKPGINKNFTDPKLDVDKFVKRFEVESREVYVARKNILDGCDIQKGDKIADVGAGTGLFTRMFSETTGDDGWVFAVDISPRFLEHINKESVKLETNNVTGVLCAENSVNLPPKSVDVAFICDTYHHFEFPNSTMTSIHRALKDDGHLIVVDFERIPGKTREWLVDHVRAGKEVFRAEIQDAGFSLVEEKKIEGLEENYFLKFRKDKD